MRNVLRSTVAAAAFVVLTGAAFAQQSPDWYNRRDARYRGEQWRGRIFTEVREDINYIQEKGLPGRDEYQLNRVKQDLNDMQGDLRSGHFDEPRLDRVMGTLQRVSADNRLSPRDREVLSDDMRRLRDYREHHEQWEHRGEREYQNQGEHREQEHRDHDDQR
jgi:hypothetical protein